MELVFFWLNHSPHGFISNQGFNFYGEHLFSVSFSNNKYDLSYTPQKVVGSKIFENSGVKNITAIVGENGSGKSTILHAIEYLNFLGEKVQEGEQDKSIENNDQSYGSQYNISIYLTDDKKFIIYDNLPKGELIINIDPTVLKKYYSANTLVCDETLPQKEYTEIIKKYDETQVKIYFSNSSYSDRRSNYSHMFGKLSKCSLTQSSLFGISRRFYEKISALPDYAMKQNDFNKLNSLLVKQMTSQHFQEICDLIYYSHLKKNHTVDTYLSKVCKNLELKVQNVSQLIDIDNIIQTENTVVYDGKEKAIDKRRKTLQRLDDIRRSDYLDIIEQLYYNLIYELICVWDFKIVREDNWDIIREKADAFIKMKKCESVNNEEKNKAAYYNIALSELDDLSKLLNGVLDISGDSPERNIKKQNGNILSLANQPELYWRFCNLIEKFATANSSFILKYISINGLHMSSGERALQNMLSWLNLIPFFNKYLGYDFVDLGENLLLLIDEIDLYMHPEWQRKIIAYLVDELKIQFPNTNIQVILTTHSPFVLSDIPKENIIFLKPEDGEFKIFNNSDSTFGANIHTLLKNGFFMKSTLGGFSENVIRELDEKLEDYKNTKKQFCESEYEEIKQKIQIIGEPVIRNFLTEKLLELVPVEVKIKYHECKIEELKASKGLTI